MRVLIVDDDAIVVQSLATILSAEDGIDVVGRAWCTVTAGMSDPQLRTTLRVWCESTLHALDDISSSVPFSFYQSC